MPHGSFGGCASACLPASQRVPSVISLDEQHVAWLSRGHLLSPGILSSLQQPNWQAQDAYKPTLLSHPTWPSGTPAGLPLPLEGGLLPPRGQRLDLG